MTKIGEPLLPTENDLLTKLTDDGYFDAIDNAKLSKRKFIETLMDVQEEERKKLGHELHDSINSSLTIAKFYLTLLKATTQQEIEAKEQLTLIISAAEQSIRSISCELVVFQEVESTLIQLVKNLVARVEALNLFIINFDHSDIKQFSYLPGCQKIVLYRIIQEQLNNTIKYSKAKKVAIELFMRNQQVTLLIKDDGVGFDLSVRGHGIGISNIINRAKQFNGLAAIDTAPGKGCTLRVSMPIIN